MRATPRARGLPAAVALAAVLAAAALFPGATFPHEVLTEAERAWLAQRGPLVYLADTDFPPFAFLDARGNVTGLNRDFLRLVSINLGVEFSFRPTPFPEVLAGVRNGTGDLAGNLAQNARREQFLEFTQPYVYVRRTGWGLATLPPPPADLGGLRIAAVEGTVLSGILVRSYPRAVVSQVANDTEGIAAVAEGRLDLFFGGLPSTAFRVRELGIENVNPVVFLEETAFSFVVAEGQATLLGILDKGLATISPEQRLALYFKWTGTDLGPSTGPPALAVPPEVTAALGVLAIAAATAGLWSYTLSRRVASRTRDLRNQAEQLAESEARFRAVASAASDAIVSTDAAGTITYANPAAERAFGWAAGDLRGRPLTALLDAPDKGPTREAIARLAAPGPAEPPGPGASAAAVEVTARHRDGTEVPLEMSVGTALRAGVASFTAVFRDVSERRRAEERRVAAAAREREVARLQELDRFKTEFLNHASHELATPLTPIALQLHLMRQRQAGLGPEDRRAVDILDRNFQRLRRLVLDIVEGARLQSGPRPPQPRDLDLAGAVREAAEAYRGVAAARGLRLEVDAPEPLPVAADPDRMAQVLDNLLSNAVRFTPGEGEVFVHASAEAGEAVVRVADSGVGLTAAQAARLFQPFTQVHDTPPTEEPGTGLGLYICKGIVGEHGGRMWAESDGPGRGSTFAFALPLAAPAAEPREGAAEPWGGAGAAPGGARAPGQGRRAAQGPGGRSRAMYGPRGR